MMLLLSQLEDGLEDILVRSRDFTELRIWKRCAQSAAMGGYMSSKLLGEDGLLVFTGASVVASGGTSFMAGYGMAKAATHHLVQSQAVMTCFW